MPNGISHPAFKVFLPEGSSSYKIEINLRESTEELNTRPLRVNRETWNRNRAAMAARVEEKVRVCQTITGRNDFRPNSREDCLSEFLDRRKLPILSTTPKGAPTMDLEVLTVYRAMGDNLADSVVEAREAMTKLSQLNAWEPYAMAGQVQATWNQLGTPMGRYSCEEPNLQNRINEIRETIEAPEGYRFVSNDLGQAEYVVWASLSKDPLLTEIFKTGQDLHSRMIAEIKAIYPALNDKFNDRPTGKMVNFALLYLMKPWALSQKLGCPQEDSQAIIQAYKKRAPVAVDYIEAYLLEVAETGKARTFYGREREISFKGLSQNAKHEVRKTAWHHHNSGTAAEILKIKQAKLHKQFRQNYNLEQVWLGLQMHDELIHVVREDVVDKVMAESLAEFQAPIKGMLDFKITQKVGKNWLETSK